MVVMRLSIVWLHVFDCEYFQIKRDDLRGATVQMQNTYNAMMQHKTKQRMDGCCSYVVRVASNFCAIVRSEGIYILVREEGGSVTLESGEGGFNGKGTYIVLAVRRGEGGSVTFWGRERGLNARYVQNAGL